MNKQKLLSFISGLLVVLSLVVFSASTLRAEPVVPTTSNPNGNVGVIQVNGGSAAASEGGEKSKSKISPVVIVVIAVVVVAGTVVSIVLIRAKKSKSSNQNNQSFQVVPSFDERHMNSSSSNNYYVILTDLNNTGRSFDVLIKDRITIGRVGCDINIKDDILLSNVQCEIKRRGKLYTINDLNSLNGTKYDHIMVYNDTPVMTGGVLEIGHQKFKVSFAERKAPMLVNKLSGECKMITNDKIRIGSMPGECDYVLSSKYVSKVHAEVYIRDGRYFVKDLESKNGTYINGVRITPKEMVEIITGTRVTLADVELLFEIEEREI